MKKKEEGNHQGPIPRPGGVRHKKLEKLASERKPVEPPTPPKRKGPPKRP